MFDSLFRLLGRIHTRREIDTFRKELVYGDFEQDADITLGQIAVLAFGVACFAGMLTNILYFSYFKKEMLSLGVTAFLVVFVLCLFGFRFYFVRVADKKAMQIENVLSSWLNLLANKLESGDSVERALLLSARPEFGLLRKELLKVVNDINLGRTVKDALKEMNTRVKSRNVDEVVKLITYAMDSGGEFAHLLKKMAIRINDKYINEQQMRAELSSQLSIISIIVLGAAPAMFGLANVLVKVVVTIVGGINIGGAEMTSIPLRFNPNPAHVDTIFFVSLISITILSIMGALMLGAIKEGELKAGVKNILPYMLVSFGVFFAARFLLMKVLGGIIGF